MLTCLVCIKTYLNRTETKIGMEAEVAKAHLRSHGIEAVIEMGGSTGGYPTFGVEKENRLLVKKQDAQQATLLLERFEQTGGLSPGEVQELRLKKDVGGSSKLLLIPAIFFLLLGVWMLFNIETIGSALIAFICLAVSVGTYFSWRSHVRLRKEQEKLKGKQSS